MNKIIGLLLTNCLLLFLSIPSYAISGVGFFCTSYQKAEGTIGWYLYGCQKVVYDTKGMPIGVEGPIKDLVMANCRYGSSSQIGCDTKLTDKKQFQNFYAHLNSGPAPMPYGQEFYNGFVLNDTEWPEGTSLGTISTCMQNTEYGIQSCRKIN